ncbi:palmitoyl-(protein) hydrolase [Aureococcus anophagefferens]|uniref:Palmitoyl-(Protein) hydrolase n=1 Tax=Aureococcus anophagefferens TaxID=44056 RepID=A0ABR1FY14_AURAN
MAVQDASINAEDLETSMHVLGNAHAPVGPGEHHDGGAREYVDQPCCTNCLISTALAPGVSSLRFNYRELDGDPRQRFRTLDGARGRPSCRLLFTRRKQRIPCFFFERPGASLCVLYLHANATDCARDAPDRAADVLRVRPAAPVHVLAVEYNGYGGADGSATVRDARPTRPRATTRPCASAAPDRVVLYGQSVGSGPACWLASRKPVAGVVLHSPIASGIRARGARRAQPRPAKISHAPYWVEGAGHNNLLEIAHEDARRRLADFLATIPQDDPPGPPRPETMSA